MHLKLTSVRKRESTVKRNHSLSCICCCLLYAPNKIFLTVFKGPETNTCLIRKSSNTVMEGCDFYGLYNEELTNPSPGSADSLWSWQRLKPFDKGGDAKAGVSFGHV